jgi:UDP-glucose 4-epimerase
MLAATSPAVQAGDVFHIASGIETSVLDLAKMLREIAGKPDHPITFAPPRAAEVSRNFARYDRARRLLRFEPKWSLRKGLEVTWQWFAQQDQRVLGVEASDS